MLYEQQCEHPKVFVNDAGFLISPSQIHSQTNSFYMGIHD